MKLDLEDDSPYRECQVQLRVTLAPVWTGNVVQGVQELLNGLVLKFVPSLDGLLLVWDNLSIDAGACAMVDPSSTHLTFSIRFTALLFAPKERCLDGRDHAEVVKGSIFTMEVHVQGPDHIGGLIEGLFNASIASQHLPMTEGKESLVEFIQDDHNGETGQEVSGRWVWKKNKKSLVKDGRLQFEVIGLNFGHDSLAVEGQCC